MDYLPPLLDELPPVRTPGDVTFERSGTTTSVEWEPVSLLETRELPFYIIMLITDSVISKRQSTVDGE